MSFKMDPGTKDPPQRIESFVVLDLEATGLAGFNRLPRITEFAAIAVSRESLMERKIQPRVRHELKFCVNPKKLIDHGASTITGLYNDMLENEGTFDAAAIELINSFLSRLKKPVCLLAHNGNGFDYKVLHGEIKRNNSSLINGILCADTLEGFRELDIAKYQTQFTNTDIIHSNNDVVGWDNRESTPKRKMDANVDNPLIEIPPKKPFKSASNILHPGVSVKKNLQFSLEGVSQTAATDSHNTVKNEGQSTEISSTISEEKNLSNRDHGNNNEVQSNSVKCLKLHHSNSLTTVTPSSMPTTDLNTCTSTTAEIVANINEIPKQKNTEFIQNSNQNNLCDDLTLGQSVSQNISSKLGCTSSAKDTSSLVSPLNSQMSDASDSMLVHAMTLFENNSSAASNLSLTGAEKKSSVTSSVSSFTGAQSVTKTVQQLGNKASPKKVSYKLEDIYKRHFGCSPSNCHSAGDDCLTLLSVISVNSPEFVDWFDKNAVDFNSLKP